MLALFSLLIQATIPYLSAANCPLFAKAAVVAKSDVNDDTASMPADCPMAAFAAKAPAGGHNDKAPHQNHPATSCALCAAMALFHKAVFAGLIALPPPLPVLQPNLIVISSIIAPKLSAASFSARAPPADQIS